MAYEIGYQKVEVAGEQNLSSVKDTGLKQSSKALFLTEVVSHMCTGYLYSCTFKMCVLLFVFCIVSQTTSNTVTSP